jgi:hypothetical protein
MERGTPAGCTSGGIILPGSVLERVEMQIPALRPAQLRLLHLTED